MDIISPAHELPDTQFFLNKLLSGLSTVDPKTKAGLSIVTGCEW